MISQYYVLGNWKSNGSQADLRRFEAEFTELANSPRTHVGVGLALPFHLLPTAVNADELQVGAQNVSAFGPGAYTGEIHAEMLVEVSCRFCLVGHSERRQYFDEAEATSLDKIKHLLQADILPVLCIGETLAQREAGQLKEVLKRQLSPLTELNKQAELVVAYEPVWAIGTGVAAKPVDVQQAHVTIDAMLAELGFKETPVLYGGSVKPGNASELAQLSAVDGFLIGGASLKAGDFTAILAHFDAAKA